jgi:hypothetical protein
VDAQEASAGLEEIRGELYKKGTKLAKSWRKRFFVLDPVGQKISYYAGAGAAEAVAAAAARTGREGDSNAGAAGEAPPQPQLHGEVYLRSVKAVSALTEEEARALKLKDGLFGFVLDEPDRTWHLAADSESERDRWIQQVRAVQQASLGDLTKAGPVKKQSNVLKQWNSRYLVCDPVTQTVMMFKTRGSEIRADVHLKDVSYSLYFVRRLMVGVWFFSKRRC